MTAGSAWLLASAALVRAASASTSSALAFATVGPTLLAAFAPTGASSSSCAALPLRDAYLAAFARCARLALRDCVRRAERDCDLVNFLSATGAATSSLGSG